MKSYILTIFLICLSIVAYSQSNHIKVKEEGDMHMISRNFEKAILKYDIAISINPKYTDAYYGRATANISLDRFNNSLEDLNKVIALDWRHAKAYYLRGFLKQSIYKEYLEAIKDFNMAIDMGKIDFDVYANRGSCKVQIGDLSGAIKDFSTSIELQPSLFAYSERGACKLKLNDYHGAVMDYTNAISFKPNDVSSYLQRADAKFNLSDFQGAILDYKKSIELLLLEETSVDPVISETYHNMALAKFKLSDTRGALNDLNLSIIRNPKNGGSYYLRGICKNYLYSDNSGCLDLSKAGELGVSKAYEAIRKYCN